MRKAMRPRDLDTIRLAIGTYHEGAIVALDFCKCERHVSVQGMEPDQDVAFVERKELQAEIHEVIQDLLFRPAAKRGVHDATF